MDGCSALALPLRMALHDVDGAALELPVDVTAKPGMFWGAQLALRSGAIQENL